MPFSLSSYLLGVGTVVGALGFGFGGTGHSADKGSADSSGQSHQGKACLIGIQLSGNLWMGA